jgi:hypothetical protein
MKKNTLLFISIVFVILIIVVGANFLFKSQDSWVCKNGQWTRKGSPQSSQPKTPCPGSENVVAMPQVPPESAAISFSKEVSKPENAGKYQNSSYLSETMKKKSETTYSCLLSIPKSTNIAEHSVIGNKAVVILQQVFSQEKKLVTFNLIVTDKTWKISNITCPK